MSANGTLYSNLVTSYDVLTELMPTQIETLVTNRLYTPANAGVAEDLEIRVSKDVKIFTNAHDDAESDFTLKIKELGESTVIETTRSTLNLNAPDYLNLNDLMINTSAACLKVSTSNVLQIQSSLKTQLVGKVEFTDAVQFGGDLYVGKSLILYNSDFSDASNVGSSQMRIGIQYNSNLDTLDFVKQTGNTKNLMGRFGGGQMLVKDNTLNALPFYDPGSYVIPIDNSSKASIFEASNIWRQNGQQLYYGTTVGENIAIGTSNNVHNFEVAGTTQINGIHFDTVNNISGINYINCIQENSVRAIISDKLTALHIASTNIINAGALKTTTLEVTATLTAVTVEANSLSLAGALQVLGTTQAQQIDLTSMNFTNNSDVSAFNGNLSTLSNDIAPWLSVNQAEVRNSMFSNDSEYISNLQDVAVSSKWRLHEYLENLEIQKFSSSLNIWETKFTFTE